MTFAAAARSARADDVELVDGSRFPGAIQGLDGGKLKIKTELAGTIEVEWDKVKSLESDRRLRVELHDGRIHRGLLALQEKTLEIREEGKPPVQVDRARVAKINSAETEWSGTFTLSYSAETGNSDSNTFFFSSEIVRETESDKILLRGHFKWEEEAGVLTDRAAYGLLKYDYRLSDDVYLYASGEVRTDRFEDLVYRSVVGAGVGYVFAKEGSLDLWAEAGPAYIHEELRDGTNDSWFGGRVAVHLNWKLFFGLELRDDLTYYPNFETLSDWQGHNEATLTTQIGGHWSLSASAITDVDYRPLPDKTKGDNSLVIGLRYKF